MDDEVPVRLVRGCRLFFENCTVDASIYREQRPVCSCLV